jgi:NADH:ubiquinone oxidoreductase subunit F (NADH-binding)
MHRGEADPGDIALLESIVKQIAGHTICALGDAIAMPVRSFLAKFPEEFKNSIKDSLDGKLPEPSRLNANFSKQFTPGH